MKDNRNSSIELMRVVAMFFIVAHHYYVNSGVVGLFDIQHLTPNMVFLQVPFRDCLREYRQESVRDWFLRHLRVPKVHILRELST